MKAVSIKNISKSFKQDKSTITALHDISFEVDRGELFGLIGPDGAGKTTLFRLLTTLMIPDSGSAQVDGYDVIRDFREIRKHIGYMPGKFSLYQDLTVEENLAFFATLFDTSIEENYELVKDIYVQIEKFKTRKAGALSGGMKQKLALSCALIHKPSVLFLDEPTTGVDTVSRKEFWELLRNLQKQNITILVSTPYMDEASLCDRVALIQAGRILDIDSPSGITKKFPKPLWAVHAHDMYNLMVQLRGMKEIESCYPFGQEHHVVFRTENEKPTVENHLRNSGHDDVTFRQIDAGIEDCFMDLMSQEHLEK
ncbi:MAG TPA: ABC transporter ATP-binding protein [Cyclobacteriaceae bacterium]|nr:ABC transporter ATP-binding protein [Cyclobacteriaceae bacterium]